MLFPVLRKDRRILLAEKLSEVLRHLPVVDLDCVFIRPDLCAKALAWLKDSRDNFIKPPEGKTT